MDLRRIARETCDTLVDYLTYQSLRVILSQLEETNPRLRIWLHTFSTHHSVQDSSRYLQALYREKPELALRIMTVRANLAEDMADSLPEMSRTSIHQANMELRRKMLEHLTQIPARNFDKDSSPSNGPQARSDESDQPPYQELPPSA